MIFILVVIVQIPDKRSLVERTNMKKMFWVAGILLMLAACSRQHDVTFFSGNLAEALTALGQQNKSVLVFFYSST